MSFSDRLRKGIFCIWVLKDCIVCAKRRMFASNSSSRRADLLFRKSFSFFSRCGRYPQYQMFFRAGVRRHALGRWPKAETVIGKRGIPSLWWMLKLPYEKKTSFTHSISFHNMFVLYLTDTINPALHLVRSPVTRILIVIKRLHTDTFMMRSQLNRS